jgi:hypothetical protein
MMDVAGSGFKAVSWVAIADVLVRGLWCNKRC